MPCNDLVIPGVGIAIICSRTGPRKLCDFCRARPHDVLCDYPLKGKRANATCSKRCCSSCAEKMGENRDFCPVHARLVGIVQVPRELLGDPDPNALQVVADLVEEKAYLVPPAFKPRDHHDWLEYYTERAAIAEYVGGEQRHIAEHLARELAGPAPRRNNHGPLFGGRP